MDGCSKLVNKGFYRQLGRFVGVVLLMLALALTTRFGARPAQAMQSGPYEVTVSITSITPNPAYIHQPVQAAVSVVARDPAGGIPGGTVEIRSGNAVQCRITLDGAGTGACSLTFTTTGRTLLRAVYVGRTPFLPGVSPETALQVIDQIHPSLSIVSHDPDPSFQNDPFPVAVRAETSGPALTGVVRVYRGSADCSTPGPQAAVDWCETSLSGGSGSCDLTPSVTGGFYLCAAYPGDTAHYPVTSAAVQHWASEENTYTRITRIDPSPSVLGKTAIVYYTVGSFFGDPPTGAVTVRSGPDQCTGTAESGQCTLTFTRPHIQQVTAAYSGGQDGEARFDPNTSLPFAHRVNAPPTDILLSGSSVKRYAPVGTTVGKLTANDPNPDESHTFALVAGVGAQYNNFFRIDGSQLTTAAPLSVAGSITIRVRTTDPAGLSYEEILRLNVTGGDITLPETGFAPGVVTRLPEQPVVKRYHAAGDLALEIPSLGVRADIVGIPVYDEGRDADWLGSQAGWLEGTAYPTWPGNTALAAHNYLPDGTPGPFARLADLHWGDTILVHAYGATYTSAVRAVDRVEPGDDSVLRHEDEPWLTLITCGSYDEKAGTYRWRVIVRAVQVDIR